MQEYAARVLIIDDEPESIALLLAYLKDHYNDLMVALEGEDGLTKAQLAIPDLILLDVSMPGMDGFEVCRRLKANVRTAEIPVVFLSSHSFIEDKLEGFRAGAVDYISKPFSDLEVLARVAVHSQSSLQRKRLEAEALSNLNQQFPNTRESLGDALFQQACRLLREHLCEKTDLYTLAHTLKTTENKLNSLFQRRLGLSLFDYSQELRLTTARQLVERGDMQIRLIASMVGYANPGDLSRAFRRRFGVSPRNYRLDAERLTTPPPEGT